MKKYVLIIISFLALILCFLLFPRKVEHAVVVNSTSSYTTMYINGKLKNYKGTLNLKRFTVVNFTYNSFKAYNFRTVDPITDRVMIKDGESYELETRGKIDLAKNTYYYSIDKDETIKTSSRGSLIIGKNNVKSFIDKHGRLKTFLITSMDYSTMRVGLSSTNFTSTYHEKVSLLTTDTTRIYSLKENFSYEVPKGTLLTIETQEGKLKISSEKVSQVCSDRVYLKGKDMVVKNIFRGSPLFNPSYNGVLEAKLYSKGISLINETDLEDYLYKVVPSEMPAYSALEALKCQAIAARTYAISDMLGNRFESQGFYVDDSTYSQVYNNTQPHEATNAAINATKGVIMMHGGVPIDAKYYSTSSGIGANYEDIWFKSDGSSENKPYLRYTNYLTDKSNIPKTEEEWLSFYKNSTLEAIDSSSPYYRWRIDMSYSTLEKILNKTLKNIYEKRRDFISITKNGKTIKQLPELVKLKDIKILKRSQGGNVSELAFIFEDVTVAVKADINVRGSIRYTKEYTNEAVAVVRYKDKPVFNSPSLPSSFFSIEKSKDIITIYGGGFGHGVGMSQYGAMNLGKKGYGFKQILDVYYKNVSLEKVY